MFINHGIFIEFSSNFHRSVQRRNFEVVLQHGRFDVMCRGSVAGSCRILDILQIRGVTGGDFSCNLQLETPLRCKL